MQKYKTIITMDIRLVLTGSLHQPSYCSEGPRGSLGDLVFSLPKQDMWTVLHLSPYELDTQLA